MLRKWLLSLIVLIPTVAFAADKWEPIPALKRVTTNGRKVASQTITKGGCTVNVAPSPGGAFLTFTCPETAWQLYVRNTDKGLQVRRAELRRTPAGNFMRVLYEANIAEIFVPYHDGDPEHRLSDNQFCHSAVCIREVTAQDIAGATAQLITMSGDTKPTAAVEIRDRGLAWMCKWGTGSHSRRGQEMVIWGTWDTGNYDYIIEYSFRDDGQMSFRLGATGWDNPNYSPGLAHMHDILWRVDVDLNGDLDDSALLESHDEVGLVGVDSEVTFNNGVEGGAVLNPV
ncbi:MAG TPA: hypothetical protein VF787_12030, partial [Thermoanaerobaculia bacterium]